MQVVEIAQTLDTRSELTTSAQWLSEPPGFRGGRFARFRPGWPYRHTGLALRYKYMISHTLGVSGDVARVGSQRLHTIEDVRRLASPSIAPFSHFPMPVPD
jgi:hypothetical protein